jgi:CBS domain-containing protein
MAKLALAKNLEPYTILTPSTSVGDALALLRKADEKYAIVGDKNQPQALVQEDTFQLLEGEDHRQLSELLERLPSLVVVDEAVDILDTEDLMDMARLLKEAQTPGLIVYREDKVVGVISRSAVARALPLSAIASSSAERLYGAASMPTRTFICRKCTPLKTRRRPSLGDEIPTCPRDWFHGPMERES